MIKFLLVECSSSFGSRCWGICTGHYCKSDLSSRGAAEMVLNQISACKGEAGDMMENTLKLGIAILRGGNIEVQTVRYIFVLKQIDQSNSSHFS